MMRRAYFQITLDIPARGEITFDFDLDYPELEEGEEESTEAEMEAEAYRAVMDSLVGKAQFLGWQNFKTQEDK